VAYILEDFHHYIGQADAVNPVVGEIRSLLRDMHKALGDRDESVYLLVPASFELPKELQGSFDKSLLKARRTTSSLDKFGQLMTDSRFISQIKPVIGVDGHIARLIQVLSQMETNNPLLVGPPGVGKTAIVEGLALAMAQGKVSKVLRDKKLYSLSLNSLIAGTRYRGDLEARLDGLIREVLENRDKVIIFIDEIQTLLDAGSAEGSMGAGDVLKPALSRGEFPCIGATTWEGAGILAKDPALARRFKKITVQEPSAEETLFILKGISGRFEEHHGIGIDPDALEAAVEMSGKYVQDACLPGKAISLIDGAAAFCALQGLERVRKLDILQEIDRILHFERDS
jgi:ATP-dependent Clp protease ATP-binding subunit ClpA